jgi:hypothetical protein
MEMIQNDSAHNAKAYAGVAMLCYPDMDRLACEYVG